jgi:hypothetical protein
MAILVYVSYANLELYHPDNSAGETKSKCFGTVGYSVYNTGACPPSVKIL